MSEGFTESVAATAVAGAEAALQQSEQSEAIAETSAALAVESAVASVEATETAEAATEIATIAAATAVDAHDTAMAAATATGEIAYATAAALREYQNAVEARFAKLESKPVDADLEPPVEELATDDPETIPVANEFHAQGGETASEQQRRRRHKFGAR